MFLVKVVFYAISTRSSNNRAGEGHIPMDLVHHKDHSRALPITNVGIPTCLYEASLGKDEVILKG